MASKQSKPTRFRNLKIAFSIASAVGFLVVIGIWVRSNSHRDTLSKVDKNRNLTMVSSENGNVYFMHANYAFDSSTVPHGWSYERYQPSKNVFWVFVFSYRSGNFAIQIPCYAAILVFGLMAVIPWVRRFSLQSSIIATTIVATGAGVLAYIYRT
jgi:hypothetical protein